MQKLKENERAKAAQLREEAQKKKKDELQAQMEELLRKQSDDLLRKRQEIEEKDELRKKVRFFRGFAKRFS